MNEISCVYDISEQKIRRLEELHKKWVDLPEMRPGTTSNHRPRTSQMIEERIEMIKADYEHLPRLVKDLKGSLDVVCREILMHCRSI